METLTKRETVEKGSDFRLKVHITNLGTGVHVTDQNVSLTCTIQVRDTSKVYDKTELTRMDDDTYIIAVATENLAKGDVLLKTATSVPDVAFPDGSRDEVKTTDTGVTII